MNGEGSNADSLNSSNSYVRSSGSTLSTFSSSPRIRRYEDMKKSYLSSSSIGGNNPTAMPPAYSSKYAGSAGSGGASYRLASLDRLAYRHKLYETNGGTGTSELTPVPPPTVPTTAVPSSLSSASTSSLSSASSTTSTTPTSFLHGNNVSLTNVNGTSTNGHNGGGLYTNGLNGTAATATSSVNVSATVVDSPRTNGLGNTSVGLANGGASATNGGLHIKTKEITLTNHVTTTSITTVQQPVSS